MVGVPEGIRTPDLRFRKPLLYPAELPGHALLLNRGTAGGKGPDDGFPVRGDGWEGAADERRRKDS